MLAGSAMSRSTTARIGRFCCSRAIDSTSISAPVLPLLFGPTITVTSASGTRVLSLKVRESMRICAMRAGPPVTGKSCRFSHSARHSPDYLT
jgi:hypothetical protein